MWNTSSHWFWKDELGCSYNKLGPWFYVEIILTLGMMVLFFYMFNLASVFYPIDSFHKTTCHVVDVNTTRWLPCSGCSKSYGRQCTYNNEANFGRCEYKKRCYESRFPCAQIQVSCEIADSSSLVSSLHKFDWKQHPYPQWHMCAVKSCHRDEDDNVDYVEAFTGIWLQNFNMTCFYQDGMPTNVVTMKPPEKKYLARWLMFCGMFVVLVIYIVYRVRRGRQFGSRNASYQGVEGGTATGTGAVLVPPPGQQQPTMMAGPGYQMQPMAPLSTCPPPAGHVPPLQQHAYPPPAGPVPTDQQPMYPPPTTTLPPSDPTTGDN